MAEITLTREKFDELKTKLKFLETEKREEITAAIKLAKEFGDLSENAEYSAAKDEQNANEMEIAKISDILLQATVIDEKAISTNAVNIGTKVKVLDLSENEEIDYSIVSTLEANSRENKISGASPIGKALSGHKVGDTVKVVTPAFSFELKILKITK